MNNATKGRSALRAWEDSKPDNFFSADTNLQHVLRRYLGNIYPTAEAHLAVVGEHAATVLDEAARIEDHLGNHPRLERWTGIGERAEQIEFHPNHDLAGRLIWSSGIMALQAEPGHIVEQLGMVYLLGHNSEAGHLCSLACTSGLIRALQQAADPAVRDKFLPPLLESHYSRMQHGAQFLTEIQGGSDVGANAVQATDAGDGAWRINGEKWFCSNVNADQFLITARPDHAPDGTHGLGLFLVPRRLDDGSTNGFYIRRLKDKLGTRTLASAEVDFRDAVAYPVGPLDRGFKITVELVLNTSRLLNAVACAGVMRRAFLEAASYACHREAFGAQIVAYPLVQEALADLKSETCAAVASSFYVAALVDKMDTGQASEDEQAMYRLLVNLNKYATSIRGTEMVHRAIEVLGGNGAIESFSVLPRLYRDMVVFESWEGTHNVLCLQALRDTARYNLHEPFARTLRNHLATVTDPALLESARVTGESLDRALGLLGRLQSSGDERYMHAHARRLADALAHAAQGTLLLAEAQWALENGLPSDKSEVAVYFANRRLRPDYGPAADAEYLGRLERLAAL